MGARRLSPADQDWMLSRGRRDPNWFIREVLGRKQWSMQERMTESVRDHDLTSVASGNSLGKTYWLANIVLWFLFNFRPSIVITTAPTGRQVPAILWGEIAKAYNGAPRPLGGRLLTQELKIAPDWYAIGFTTARGQPDSFAGFHSAHVLAAVDESNGVSDSIHEGIDGILASGHARKVEIGNPLDPSSAFARSFRLPSVSKFHMGAFDSPNFTEFGITIEDIRTGEWERKIEGKKLPYPNLVNPRWVRQKWEKWKEDSPAFTARVFGRFPASSPRAVFPHALIRKSQELEITPIESAPRIMGVDVARQGGDETVFVLRHAGRARVVYRSMDSRPDTMETAGRVIQEARVHRVTRVNIDVGNMGAGVVDRLREMNPAGLQIEAVNFGAGAVDPETYKNCRAECYWNVRTQMEDGKLDIDPDDIDLEADLQSIEWKPDSGGKIQIKSKEEMPDSPDLADALALAYADQTEPQWWVA